MKACGIVVASLTSGSPSSTAASLLAAGCHLGASQIKRRVKGVCSCAHARLCVSVRILLEHLIMSKTDGERR